jgi:hypothetical protein
MPVSATTLTQSQNTTNTSTGYTTASITPGANQLILAWVITTVSSGDAPQPTLTGNGLTWTHVDPAPATGARRIWLLRGMAASPTAGTVSITSGGVTTSGCLWIIAAFDGVDTSGTHGSGAIVQYITQQQTTINYTATLTNAVTAGNASALGIQTPAENSVTADTGLTELGDVIMTTPSTAIGAAWRADGTQSMTINGTSSNIKRGIAVEIKQAAAGGTSHAVTATGVTATSGGAAAGRTITFVAAGVTATSGGAAQVRLAAVTATGVTPTVGVAAITRVTGPVSHAVTAAGVTATSGGAAQARTTTVTSAAVSSSAGSAAVRATTTLTASSATATAGSATLARTFTATATGVTATSGTAAALSGVTLAATGVTPTSGAATITRTTSLTATGTSEVVGSAAQVLETTVTAEATTVTSGQALLATSTPVTAEGITALVGTAELAALIELVAAGVTETSGTARFGRALTGLDITLVAGAPVLTFTAQAAELDWQTGLPLTVFAAGEPTLPFRVGPPDI